ncbi:hypothetical protein BLOT_006612 [Blomia tropicalis]|nr:hypothetical protein BLOT_006612 [Blomia tropicalis]
MVVAVSFTIASIPMVDFGWLNSIRFIDARNGFSLNRFNTNTYECHDCVLTFKIPSINLPMFAIGTRI